MRSHTLIKSFLWSWRESMFSELVALTNEYCVSGILGAPVIRAME